MSLHNLYHLQGSATTVLQSPREGPIKSHTSIFPLSWMVWTRIKTSLPHLTRTNKSAFNMWVMRTHVTGALAHGRHSYTFVDLHLWPHDANLTCTILLEILQHQKQQSGTLPQMFYLQLNNCFRENKNQLFFGFAALLVHYRVFKEVHNYTHTNKCFTQYSG